MGVPKIIADVPFQRDGVTSRGAHDPAVVHGWHLARHPVSPPKEKTMSNPGEQPAPLPDETGRGVEEAATEPDPAVQNMSAEFLKSDEPTGSA